MKTKLLLLLLINTLLLSNTVELTLEEKNFLKTHPIITLGSDSNCHPILFKTQWRDRGV